MYVIDLVKRLTNKQNLPVLIYLILNFFVTGLLIFSLPAMFGETSVKTFFSCLGIGIVIYAISIFIALSPIGEFIIRLQTGCKKIKRVEQINFLEPLFREAYEKAKVADPSIPDNVQLFINKDKAPNAFATGRKTICVTEGLLHTPEEQIKATLGHEFGHIAHKDTDLIMLVSVGNLIVSGFILIIRAIIGIIQLAFSIAGLVAGGSEGAVMRVLTSLGNLMVTAIIGGLTKLWTKLGVLLVMKSSRGNEYLADEFSFNLGYGNYLCELLESIDDGEKPEGLFATLSSSHPDTDDRIARLQELGASYRATYGSASNASAVKSTSTQSSSSVGISPKSAAFSGTPVTSTVSSATSQSVLPNTTSQTEVQSQLIKYGIKKLDDSSFCEQCDEFTEEVYFFALKSGNRIQKLKVCKKCAIKIKKKVDARNQLIQ